MRSLKIMAMFVTAFFCMLAYVTTALIAIWLPFGALTFCCDSMHWHTSVGISSFFIICWAYVFIADKFGYLDELHH